ncbi:MAG: hypothetical protein KTR13_08115 [Saprospiraceae bacterium]|nr:hypothetical protein [Saprospiraceae bacterium]
MQERTIDLYQERDFGDKISATFQFVRENFKLLFPTILITSGPFFLLSGLAAAMYQNYLFGGFNSDSGLEDFGFEMLFVFQIIAVILRYIGILFLFAGLYEYVINYKADKNNMPDYLTIAKRSFRHAPKILLGGIVAGLLTIIACFFLLIPGIYLGVVFSFLLWVMIFEKRGLGVAMGRCFEIIKEHWWSTFGLIVIMSILQGIVGAIFSLPAGIVSGLTMTMGESAVLKLFNLVLLSVTTVFASLFYVLTPVS